MASRTCGLKDGARSAEVGRLKQYSLEMLTPRYAVLDAAPLAWSDVTRGPATAELVYAPYGSAGQTLDPKKLQAELDEYMARVEGKAQEQGRSHDPSAGADARLAGFVFPL